MRFTVPLLASIALHGAVLTFIELAGTDIVPHVVSLPRRTLMLSIEQLHDQATPALTRRIEKPRRDTPLRSLVGAPRGELAPPTASANPAPAKIETGESPRVPNADASTATPPRLDAAYLDNPDLRYPAIARRRGLEGHVLLEVDVDAHGYPLKVRAVEGSGEEILDQAAIEAVRGWRFVPVMRGGEPVAGSVRVPISFRLGRR